jgi:hypothetical protein
MFHTEISADLPSQETPGAAPSDDSYATSHDRVLFSAARLILTLRQALDGAGVRDVTHVVIDGDCFYQDDSESDAKDLDRLLEVTREEGYLNRDFHEMIVGLCHWEDGVQHVLSVRVRMAVPVGEHELVIRIASRPDDFNARRLDDAERYAGRLLEFAADLDGLTRYRLKVEGLARRIVTSLGRQLFRREIHQGRTVFRVLRPRRDDLLSMNYLSFGGGIKPPTYRLRPLAPEGSWDDPSIAVYDDPFLVFRHWVFLHALMVEGFLRVEWVEVMQPDLSPLFPGHKARWFERWPWARKFDVDLVDGGGVVVQFLQ